MTAIDPTPADAEATADTPSADDPERVLLVQLLNEAAKLEHCLLDAYLYTASSLKSTPQEFATLPDGRVNLRRAIQFERARLWKQMILEVSHEEMLHLHYVQTLLRSLDERPQFALPDRNPDTDNWIMADWHAMVGTEPVNDGKGVEIPVDGATIDNLRRFVLYEATDALQDMDPYGPEARQLFRDLANVELQIRLESMLLQVEDEREREARRAQLQQLYTELLPAEPVAEEAAASILAQAVPEQAESFAFQSIADFYNHQVLPRFRDAFTNGWVRQADRDLVNELQDPEHAGEGFLPMKMVYRDKNFEKQAQQNVSQPLMGVRSVEDIILEIVEEGEGATDFAASAHALVATIEEVGARAYVQAMLDDQAGKDTPGWFADGQLVRTSHLYRFAVLLTGMEEEATLAAAAGTTFSAVRDPLDLVDRSDVADPSGLVSLADDLPAQFNACYLVLAAWLSRMYEIKDWMADKPRRLSIEMLASWPLMSMAIRPMLELASFLPIDRSMLFRFEDAALPEGGSTHELLALWEGEERSEDVNERIDRLALQALTEVAAWASGRVAVVEAADGLDDNTRTMMAARLQELGYLREFEKEFPYRNAGGYSDREPDLTYTQLHPHGPDFEETPTMSGVDDSPPLFDQSLVLRVRFAGWGLVQLATDPDPTFDEVGVTGTHMLHAADGDRRFDRALVWDADADPDSTILRGPRDELPPVGVDVVDVSLCVAPGPAPAGYVPLQVMNSTGAVQTSGLQQDVEVSGLHEVVVLPSGTMTPATVTLRSRDGTPPFLNGLNHVVSQDGEAIDPFVLSVRSARARGQDVVLEREAYTRDGTTFLDMTPLQRLDSGRRPSGFDASANVPDWVRHVLPEEFRSTVGTGPFPDQWLSSRARTLGADLGRELDASLADGTWTQSSVDDVVSLAERMALVNVPKGTTVGWLMALLHYGHTVSGTVHEDGGGPLLEAIRERYGVPVSVAACERDASNGRWLARYTLGVMDTDSLRNVVYGDLMVPLATDGADDVRFVQRWEVRSDMATTVAAVACRFHDPFWGDYTVTGDTRTPTVADGTTFTDHLVSQQSQAYSWTTSGLDGVGSFEARMELRADGDGPTRVLEFEVKLATTSAAGTVAAVGLFATIAGAIPDAFADDVGLTVLR